MYFPECSLAKRIARKKSCSKEFRATSSEIFTYLYIVSYVFDGIDRFIQDCNIKKSDKCWIFTRLSPAARPGL